MEFITGKTLRLVNFLLDSIFYFLFLIVLMLIFKEVISIENVKWLSCILYFLYYFLSESLTGRTIAKVLTKSKVVSTREDDSYYLLRIFIRTLTRLIPIDIISFLFAQKGLHDIISNTSVDKIVAGK